MLVSVNDPRYLSGELISTIKNKVVVKNKNDNIFQVDKNDPRYLSKELVSINKSKVAVKDKDGNTFQCDINDSRYLSGELVSAVKGKVCAKDENGNYIVVSVNDERYLSGELKHNMVGKKLSEEHKANISKGSSGENNGFYGKTHEDYVLDIVSNLYEIDGRIFRGRKVVAELYNICEKSVTHRCKSANYPNWILIKPRK